MFLQFGSNERRKMIFNILLFVLGIITGLFIGWYVMSNYYETRIANDMFFTKQEKAELWNDMETVAQSRKLFAEGKGQDWEVFKKKYAKKQREEFGRKKK